LKQYGKQIGRKNIGDQTSFAIISVTNEASTVRGRNSNEQEKTG
jgi:hypothetical protein